MKKLFVIFLVIVAILLIGCESKNDKTISNLSNPLETLEEDTKELTEEEKQNQKDFENSTPDNDTDFGLKTVKIDTADATLTEDQRYVLKYFDNDYFDISDYEFLRRYPQVFSESQVTVVGSVYKIISQNGNKYEALLWIGSPYTDTDKSDIILINGETEGALFMENDELSIYGQYDGVKTINVDGVSVTVPVVKIYDAYMPDIASRFSFPFIKKVAKCVFGEDIEIRKLQGNELSGLPTNRDFYYAVELENQTISKMSKYYFKTDTGAIVDQSIFFDGESSIERHIEFSADLKHFYVVSYDWSLCTFTIECYNHNLEKVWKREFEEIQAPETEGLMDRLYDYTKNNFYLVLNNELYTINAMTGEDTKQPIYVGQKVSISKLKDGLLLVAKGKADSIMKVDLEGRMIWKTNTSTNIWNVESIQVNKDNIVVHTANEGGYHYYVLDNDTGVTIVDAVTMQ